MATYKRLDDNGLLYFAQSFKNRIKALIPTKTSDLTNDSNFIRDASYVHTDSNYTAAEKTKLAGIATGANVNVQADWNETDTSSDAYIANKPTIPSGVSPSSTTPLMDGTASAGSETQFARGDHRHPTDTSRAPLASPEFTGMPTAPTAPNGTNDARIATTAFVTTAITNAISGITGIEFEIIQAFPVSPRTGTIYLMAKSSSSSGNIYDEYIYVNNAWELIGTTQVDLSGYVQATEMAVITNTEIDTILTTAFTD